MEILEPMKETEPVTTDETLESQQTPRVCSICFERYREGDPPSSWHPACGHSYCGTCLVGYFSEKISTHNLDITCPECSTLVEPDTVRKILFEFGTTNELAGASTTEEARSVAKNLPLAKYDTLSALANDPRSAACPRCAVVGRPAGGRRSNAIECGGCGLEFCARHGDAHPGRTCRQFEHSTRKSIKANERYIARTNKIVKCPKCSVNIEKNHGCNHMQCTQCQHRFCWCCGRDYNSALHFDGNIWMCPAELWGGDNWGTARLWSARALHVTLTPVALGLGLVAGSIACVVAPPVIITNRVLARRRRARLQARGLAFDNATQIIYRNDVSQHRSSMSLVGYPDRFGDDAFMGHRMYDLEPQLLRLHKQVSTVAVQLPPRPADEAAAAALLIQQRWRQLHGNTRAVRSPAFESDQHANR